ncbi:MAG: ribonuclease HII [Candidatus Nealsonbacteria bacterium]|nr:ribonuclease HII [Candidatus Nealsonbacteria bacterium]
MFYPNLKEEKKLWKKRIKCAVGLDEACRGPLAGPVAAGAIMIKTKSFSFFPIRDSKKLSAKKREYFFKIITKHPELEWGIGIVSEKTIDRINIFEATKLAMKKALIDLEKKLKKGSPKKSRGAGPLGLIDFLILDGNFKLDNVNISQKSIIKADEKVFSCAAASIIAKVTRDRIMEKYHKKYPVYRFNEHKGYPTKLHFKLIKKYGSCPIHRKSFRLGLAK